MQFTESRSSKLKEYFKSGISLAEKIYDIKSKKIKFLFMTRYQIAELGEDSDERIRGLSGVLIMKPELLADDSCEYYKYSTERDLPYECKTLSGSEKGIVDSFYEKESDYYNLIGQILEIAWEK